MCYYFSNYQSLAVFEVQKIAQLGWLFDSSIQIPEGLLIKREKNLLVPHTGQTAQSLLINVIDLVPGMIQDVVVMLEVDSLLVYLLVGESLTTGDTTGALVGLSKKAVHKFRLNRTNIKKILTGKILSEEHEDALQAHQSVYEYARSNAKRMYLPFERDKTFLFVCDNCLIFLNKAFYFIITSATQLNSPEFKAQKFNEGQIYVLQTAVFTFSELKYTPVYQKVQLYLKGVTLSLLEMESKVTVLIFQNSQPIMDIDLIAAKVVYDLGSGDLGQQKFEVDLFQPLAIPSKLLNFQIFHSQMITRQANSSPQDDLKLHLARTEDNRTTLVQGSTFSIQTEYEYSAKLIQKFENDRELKLASLSSAIPNLAVTRENQILSLDLKSFSLGTAWFENETFGYIIEVIDRFYDQNHAIVLEEKAIKIIRKSSQTIACTASLAYLPKKIKTIIDLLFVLSNEGILHVYMFAESGLTQISILSEDQLEQIADIAVFENQLLLMYVSNILEIFSYENKEFHKSMTFNMNDACNVIQHEHNSIEDDSRANFTSSITNTYVKVPKKGRTEFNPVAAIDFFLFNDCNYLVLLYSDGAVILYKLFYSSLLRVHSKYTVSALKVGIAESTISAHALENCCLISITNNRTFCLTIKNSREEISVLFGKVYSSIFTHRNSIIACNENEVDLYEVQSNHYEASIATTPGSKVISAQVLTGYKVRNGRNTCNLILVHKQIQDNIEFFEFYDKLGRLVGVLNLNERERVLLIKQLIFDDGDQELFVGYSAPSGSSSDYTSKWKFLDIQLVSNNYDDALRCEINLLLDQTCQEPGRQIKGAFTISRNTFICLDDKILQIEHGKIKKIYEVNLHSISHVALKSNYVLMADVKDRILFSVWNTEKRELFERSACNTDCLIKDLFFLNDQSVRVG